MKTNKNYKSSLGRLNRYLKQNGLRPSPVRNMVLEQICNLHQPFTAEQLVEACREERISLGTVYNSLKLFTQAEIIQGMQRQRGHIATEYELISDSSQRMQFVCKKCGRVVEFNDKAIAQFIENRKYTNFNLHCYSLVVYGECKVCRVKRNRVTALNS